MKYYTMVTWTLRSHALRFYEFSLRQRFAIELMKLKGIMPIICFYFLHNVVIYKCTIYLVHSVRHGLNFALFTKS